MTFLFFFLGRQVVRVFSKHIYKQFKFKTFIHYSLGKSHRRIKTLRYQLGEVYNELTEVALDPIKDPGTTIKAKTLSEKVSKFKVCSIVLWYNILFKINVVSKFLQSKNIVLSECLKCLNQILEYFQDMRNLGLNSILQTSKGTADEIEIVPEFKGKERFIIKT